MKHQIAILFVLSALATNPILAAGIESLTPAPVKSTPKVEDVAPTEAVENQIPAPDTPIMTPPPAGVTPPVNGAGAPEQKAIPRSALSKKLDSRLSLGTSIGWGVVKPAKGTWIGLGTSELSFQYRNSAKADGKLYITGRYAPFAGVWTVDKRDYDTTLHGLYGGAEIHLPGTPLPSTTLKAGVELGYMLVYAKPQDRAEADSAVKGGKLNLTAGGGMDWSLLDNKIKVGPFARLHLIGFTIVNVGASARFVF